MGYKYQMHAHTYPCSACGRMKIEELIDALYAGGYQGCVITNHFINGNCGIDRALPWEDFVKEYEIDYLKGKACAEKYGIDLIFGIEEGVSGGKEILCYGVTPEILYAHPELAARSAETWHKVMKSYGVLVIQAHPFRERAYIPAPGVLADKLIDGIEVYNNENIASNNESAKEAAESHFGWILVSGADTHSVDTACCAGIECDERITDEKELVSLLKSRKYRLITE